MRGGARSRGARGGGAPIDPFDVPASPAKSWLADEPPLAREGWTITRRLAHRARASWPVWCVAALLVAGVITLKRARVPARYEVSIVLRVTEGSTAIPGAQLGAGVLRAHLNELVFTRTRLSELMRRHPKVFPDLEQDPATTLEEFRDRMTIAITDTNFTEERSPEDPPRSARLQISYLSNNPELSFTIATELSQMVMGSTIDKKRGELEREQEAVTAALTAAEAELGRAVAEAPPPATPGMIDPLVSAARSRMLMARQRLDALLLAQRALGEGQSLKFAVVDPGRVPPRADTRGALFAGLLSTLLAALLAGMLVAGAFDPRVLDEEDLTDLGGTILGRLPLLARRAPPAPPASGPSGG